jgi:hypothetical protein
VKAEEQGSETTALKPIRKTHYPAANSTGKVGNPTHCTVLAKVAIQGVTADITLDVGAGRVKVKVLLGYLCLADHTVL